MKAQYLLLWHETIINMYILQHIFYNTSCQIQVTNYIYIFMSKHHNHSSRKPKPFKCLLRSALPRITVINISYLAVSIGNISKQVSTFKNIMLTSVRAVEGGPGGPWPPQYLALPRLEISANTKKKPQSQSETCGQGLKPLF